MVKLYIENISKSFGILEVLDKITMKIQNKEFVSILGPSGCGKSTLFNIISGLLSADEGKILLDGLELTGQTGHVGFMHQKDLLLPWKTILDNTAIPLILKGQSRTTARIKALKYFKDFGLEGFEGSYPRELSGGMRQRAALLRTYLFKNDLMLLDEPFGGLDAITRRHMQQWLLNIIRKYDSTVLMITHDIEEAILLSDKIYVMSQRPASISRELKIELERPRRQDTVTTEKFIDYKRELLNIL